MKLTVNSLDVTASEQGVRQNIYKATLREWPRQFARHLRDQGIAANATERAVRGEIRTAKTDGIYRATLRGDSTHTRKRVHAVASDLLKGDLRVEPGKAKLMETRKQVERGWRSIASQLARDGHQALADGVSRFVERMSPPKTERERIAVDLLQRSRTTAVNDAPTR